MSMKRLLLAIAMCVPLTAQAAATFFWRAESATLTASVDLSPDTSATATGGVSISTTAVKVGTNGVLTTNATDYYAFTSTGICDVTQGAVSGWIQFKTSVPASGLDVLAKCMNTGDTSEAGISTGSSQEIRLTLAAAGGTTVNLATSSCNFAIDNWYYVVASWHIANDDRAIACYNSSGTLIDSATDLATDLAAAAPGSFDEFRVANPSSHADVVWVDNIFASATWAEPFENFHSITSITPTYSAGPTNGTFTNTTLPFTYTPDQNGTTYAAACTNGQTVTSFANLKTGTCSGGAAVGTGTDVSVATVSDTVIITGLVASTTYDVYIGHESTIGGQSTVASLADRATTGASINFSVGPSEAPAADGFTIAGTITCTGTCTVEAVACSPGDAVPISNEIEAGQCGGGNAALMNAQENWVTGVSNDFLLTSANKPVRFDVYVSGTDGTTDTSVNSLLDQDRTIRTGFLSIAITGVATTGVCDLDSTFDPDCAIGDVFEYEDDTNESADCNILFEADGDFTLTPVAAGDCDNRRSFEISYEDVSSATTGLFTAPTVGNFTTDDTIYINNVAPDCPIEPEAQTVVLTEDAAMTARNLAIIGSCSDFEGDLITYSVTGGTLPVGTALGGAGNKDWTGTPTTENEAGTLITVTATDIVGATDTFTFTVYVINTFAVPNCVGNSFAECSDEIVYAAPWRVDNAGLTVSGYTCGTGQPFLSVATQTPTAGAAATSDQSVIVTIVGGVIPNLVGLTTAAAIAAIAAICP